jgi:hypothetical protein
MRCWSACQALQVARQDHGMRHHSTSSVHKHKELPQRFCHSPRGERCICWRFHEAAMAACLAAHAQMSRSRAESELVMAACIMLCTSCASIVHTCKVRNHGAMSLCVSIAGCRKSCMMPSHRDSDAAALNAMQHGLRHMHCCLHHRRQGALQRQAYHYASNLRRSLAIVGLALCVR